MPFLMAQQSKFVHRRPSFGSIMSGTIEEERRGLPSTSSEPDQHQGPFDGLSHLAGGLEVGPTPTDDYEEVSLPFMLNDGDPFSTDAAPTHAHLGSCDLQLLRLSQRMCPPVLILDVVQGSCTRATCYCLLAEPLPVVLQLDIGRLAFVDTAAARARYQRLKQRMNTPRRIVARDKAAFVMGTLGLTYALS